MSSFLQSQIRNRAENVQSVADSLNQTKGGYFDEIRGAAENSYNLNLEEYADELNSEISKQIAEKSEGVNVLLQTPVFYNTGKDFYSALGDTGKLPFDYIGTGVKKVAGKTIENISKGVNNKLDEGRALVEKVKGNINDFISLPTDQERARALGTYSTTTKLTEEVPPPQPQISEKEYNEIYDGDIQPQQRKFPRPEPKEENPLTEPVAETVVEPVTEPVTEPVVEPVVEPVTVPVVEPVAAPTEEPLVGGFMRGETKINDGAYRIGKSPTAIANTPPPQEVQGPLVITRGDGVTSTNLLEAESGSRGGFASGLLVKTPNELKLIDAANAAKTASAVTVEDAVTPIVAEDAVAPIIAPLVAGDAALAETGVGAPVAGAIAVLGGIGFGLYELLGHHSHKPKTPNMPDFTPTPFQSQYNAASAVLANTSNVVNSAQGTMDF
tara:strand:- start:158 stop:1477 length:1320 start_codon:yes stop_codon:yes gene_type:complete